MIYKQTMKEIPMRTKLFILTLLLMLFIAPTLAHEGETHGHKLSYDGFSVSYDAAFGDTVNISRYPGDPAEGAAPGFTDAAYTQFNIGYLPMSPDSFFDSQAGIRVYRAEDIAQYDFLQAEYDKLQQLLTEQPDLSEYVTQVEAEIAPSLPYIPVLTHGRSLQARVHYVEGEAIQGVAYITYTTAAAEPILSDSLIYTFQGISRDGQYYVNATFKLHTDLFPAEIPADFNIETFGSEWPEYLAESAVTLSEAAPEAFSPSLDLMDALAESIEFGE